MKNKLFFIGKVHLIDYPAPLGINYNWSFVALSGIFALVQVVTGVLLAVHYISYIDVVFETMEHIMRNVNNGWLLHYYLLFIKFYILKIMLFFLSLSFILYFLGLFNCIFINNKNILIFFLIFSEIMFLGLDLLFIGTGLLMNNFNGIIFGFILLMLTVCESVIGLGLHIVTLKLATTINFINFFKLNKHD